MFEKESVFAAAVSKEAVLTGSEKQIRWARDIIQSFAFGMTTSGRYFKPEADFEKACEFVRWMVKTHRAAKWWIENRDNYYGYLGLDTLLKDFENADGLLDKELETAEKLAQEALLSGSEKEISRARDLIKMFAFIAFVPCQPTRENGDALAFVSWTISKHPKASWWLAIQRKGSEFIEIVYEDFEGETKGL